MLVLPTMPLPIALNRRPSARDKDSSIRCCIWFNLARHHSALLQIRLTTMPHPAVSDGAKYFMCKFANRKGEIQIRGLTTTHRQLQADDLDLRRDSILGLEYYSVLCTLYNKNGSLWRGTVRSEGYTG